MPILTANPGRTVVIPDDVGAIYATRLAFPIKPQMATIDYSIDITALALADGLTCVNAEVVVLGPDTQLIPLVVAQAPVPGNIITALFAGGDLYVSYAIRFNFTLGGAGKSSKTYSLDVWLTVANVASYSGQYGGYMSNTGYPTGTGPRGQSGTGITQAAPNSGLDITGSTITINGELLPTSPVGLVKGAPWNNNNTLSFANGDDT